MILYKISGLKSSREIHKVHVTQYLETWMYSVLGNVDVLKRNFKIEALCHHFDITCLKIYEDIS